MASPCVRGSVASLLVASLEHAQDLEEVEEEVDDVEVEGDRRLDVVVGAVEVEEVARVVEDEAAEEERADQREMKENPQDPAEVAFYREKFLMESRALFEARRLSRD